MNYQQLLFSFKANYFLIGQGEDKHLAWIKYSDIGTVTYTFGLGLYKYIEFKSVARKATECPQCDVRLPKHFRQNINNLAYDFYSSFKCTQKKVLVNIFFWAIKPKCYMIWSVINLRLVNTKKILKFQKSYLPYSFIFIFFYAIQIQSFKKY